MRPPTTCLTCGQPSQGSRCYLCQQARDRQRDAKRWDNMTDLERATRAVHLRAMKLLRQQVYDRDGARCAICGHTGDKTNPLTLDHYPVPRAQGGPTTLDNLRVLCRRHNSQTGGSVRA